MFRYFGEVQLNNFRRAVVTNLVEEIDSIDIGETVTRATTDSAPEIVPEAQLRYVGA